MVLDVDEKSVDEIVEKIISKLADCGFVEF